MNTIWVIALYSQLTLSTGSVWQIQPTSDQKKKIQKVSLEKARVLQLFWTEGHISFWHIERCAGFIASKGDDAWLFVKIDRNTNTQNNQKKSGKKKKTEKKKSGLALVMSAKIGFKEKKITMDIGHYIIIKEQHSKKTY